MHSYYLAFLVVPFVVEVLLRVKYVLTRSLAVNSSNLLENQPIIVKADDKANRTPTVEAIGKDIRTSYFANSFSIGVIGDWGIGKTSFIKLLEQELKNDGIIIHFNPWLSVGRSSLIQEFIESLKERLGKYDRSVIYSLDKYLLSLIEIEKNIKTNFTDVVYRYFRDDKSAASEFLNVKRAIERIGKRIIVFVDDFDRLDKYEIVDVLKLIRNTGNFTNIVYISCYDKIYLLHSLEKFSKRNLTAILDKFFDIEIPLAPIPLNKLIEEINTKFFTPFKIGDGDAKEIIEKLGNDTFLQFREVKKVLMSLIMNYNLYGKALFIQDFFLFEVLRVRFPFLPNILWNRRETFFIEFGSPAIIHLHAQEEVHLEEKTERLYYFDQYLSNNERDEASKHFLNESEKSLIIRLLRTLFPGMSLGSPYAIQEPKFFQNYFYSAIPDVEITDLNWFQLIKTNAFRNNSYFSEPYDLKKEESLQTALFRNKHIFQTNFGASDSDFFKFLLFLIEWSDGKLTPALLVEAYQFTNHQNKVDHFAQLISTPSNSATGVLSRTKFLSTLIRDIIYNGSKFEFIDPAVLKERSQVLFQKYLSLIDEFTNETFEALYQQIEDINLDTKIVSISEHAITSLKRYVIDNPVEYLDLNIRSYMVPNSTGDFVFEPVTVPKMFGDILSFQEFIRNANYPKVRKDVLLKYLEKSAENRDGVLGFNLSMDEMQYMPIEFKNGWSNVATSVKNEIGNTTTSIDIKLSNQPVTPAKPETNDHVLDQLFEMFEGEYIFRIVPVKTEFWRFGLKFKPDKKFPKVHDRRHPSVDPNAPSNDVDIILTVGTSQKMKDSARVWENPGLLRMSHYNISPQSNFLAEHNKYSGEEIKLILKISNLPTKNFGTFEVFVSDKSLGTSGYDLSGHRFFRISAWADETSFDLDVKITCVMKLHA